MNLLDKMLSRLGYMKASQIRKLSAMSHEYVMGRPQPELYSDYDVAYARMIWVYACVKAIANAASGVPLKVYRRVGDEVEDGSDSIMATTLERPNPHTTRSNLWLYTLSALELAGNSYWELEENDLGMPAAIYPLMPRRVKIVPDPDEYIRGILYEVNGRQIALEAKDVIHIRYHNPNDEYYGQGSISAARNSITTDYYSQTYNKNLLKNDARPGGVLETDARLTDDDYTRLLRQWEAAHKGPEQANRIAILEEGLEYKDVGLSARDMQFLQQREMSREEICASFEVPPAIVGIFRYANYANSQMQFKKFWQSTMLPKLTLVEERINATLAPRYSRETKDRKGRSTQVSYFVKFDTSVIEALRENLVEKVDIAHKLFQMGYPANEINDRLELGFEPIPGGDVGYLPINIIPVGSAPPPPPENGKGSPATHLPGNKSATTKTDLDAIFFDKYAAQKQLADAGEQHLMAGLESGGTAAIAEVGADIVFDLYDEKISRWLQTRTFQFSFQVTDTTLKHLGHTLSQGMEAGETIEQLADRVNGIFDFADRHRSIRIARTETLSASNYATLEGYAQSGVVGGKGWLHGGGGTMPREWHVAMHGEVRKLDEPFSNGQQYPGDPAGGAEENANCTCTTVPVMPEDMGTGIINFQKDWDAFFGRLRQVEKPFASDLRKLFREQRQEVLANLRAQMGT